MALRISQSGRTLSAGADPCEVVLSSNGPTHKLRCVAPVSSAALTHDGAIAATGDRGGLLTLWDTATGARGVQCVAASAVLAIAFSPDARAVASGRSDGATVWAVADGARLYDVDAAHVNSAAFTADALLLGCGDLSGGGGGGGVLVCDASTGATRHHLRCPTAVVQVLVAGPTIVASDSRKRTTLFDAATGECIDRGGDDGEPDDETTATETTPARRSSLAASAARAVAAAGRALLATPRVSLLGPFIAVDSKLPPVVVAQRTAVVRLPKLLDDSEIAALGALAARLPLGGDHVEHVITAAAHVTALARRKCYLSQGGTFAAELPELRAKMLDAVRRADAKHWKLLQHRTVAPRCVEYHRLVPGKDCLSPDHADHGSVITIDVLLNTPGVDFEGGVLMTREADGTDAAHPLEKGDAAVFVSHKPHFVSPVTAGERRVLVIELWEGSERPCNHRCQVREGPRCDEEVK